MKKNESIEILSGKALEEFINHNDEIYECNLCNQKPQIIRKNSIDQYELPETKYKIYCSNCQVGTGFSAFSSSSVSNWNKKMRPSKYRDCFIFAFTPIENHNNAVILENYHIDFELKQYDIIQGKGGDSFLYYVFDEKEQKLNLNNFVDNVAIYGSNQFSILSSDGIPSFNVCVSLAKNKEEAIQSLNNRLKDFFTEIRDSLYERVKRAEKHLENEKSILNNFENYITDKENK